MDSISPTLRYFPWMTIACDLDYETLRCINCHLSVNRILRHVAAVAMTLVGLIIKMILRVLTEVYLCLISVAVVCDKTTNGYNMAQQTYYGPSSFGEDQADAFDFTEQSIRRGFIRKVYAILMCQLLVTMGFISLFLFHTPTQEFVKQNPYLLWIALVVLIVCLIAMACCPEVRRTAPMNFIFLALFTLAQSFLLGIVTGAYNVSEVMMAVGITAAVCLGLTLFAFQTKWDFTMMGGALVAASIVLLVFGILALIIRSNILTIVYAAAGALIFSLYLVYDTQLMMGGKHKYSISPEEYIFAALNLYLDIVNIFLFILTIIGATK